MPGQIELIINGERHAVPAEPERSLLVVLREELGLTGAKYGCAVGACGACTVLVDGTPARACVTPAAEAAGHTVTTIEGLTPAGGLHPVQQAFVATGAMQCGYCTPGMVAATAALLAANPTPGEHEIVRALGGNICRCGTYPRIMTAVREAAGLRRAPAPGEGTETHQAEPAGGHPPRGLHDPERLPRAAPIAPPPRRPWDLLPPDERDYFGVLSDGLVAVLLPATTAGAPGPAWLRNGGAWLHVGADGTVTAFTGKVDVGQDNATALAMIVAEELRVPLPAVRMVMGDTDVCPYDMGTFGSRSMPDAGQDLQVTAAAARQALIGMAAAAWEVDPSGLTAAEGTVRTPGSGSPRAAVPCQPGGTTPRNPPGGPRPDQEPVRTPGSGSPRAAVRDKTGDHTASYAELLRGVRRVVTASRDMPVTDRRAWHTAGAPRPRPDAADAVRGAKRFTSDLSLPGMLHGKVLRPPAYGATLLAADLGRARSVPGVIAVHDGAMVGVAGPDPVTAGHALALIDARWERSAQVSERDLVRHLRLNPLDIEGWGGPYHEETGDVTAALDTADVRLAATYTTAYIAHVPLEPRVALAQWSQGRLTVWTGTQRPFGVRAELAQALGVAETDVRVMVPPTGSGFGGKHAGQVAVEAARLARAAGRPVKVQWSREEEFTWGYFRPAAVVDVDSGARVGGAAGERAAAGTDTTLLAWDFTNVNSGAAGIGMPYEVPNKRITFQPARSPLPQGPYRALAATANNFARESHIDELAHELGVDPLEFRLRQLADDRLAAVLRAAAERAGWQGGTVGPRRGLGIACGVEKDGRVATCADVTVTADGRLNVHRIVTAYECGTVVNPGNVVNQVEGATVMALGGALFEAIHFDDGVILNGSLATYRVPRFSDVPPIEVVLVDRRDLPPAGAGETPLIAVAPALANAIFAATRQRLRSLPLLPDGTVPTGPP